MTVFSNRNPGRRDLGRALLAAGVLAASGGAVRAAGGRRKVIFDTDPGIDDTMALMWLRASPDIDIVALTSAAGNGTIETTTRNALFLADRLGIAAPVARGQGPSLDGVVSVPPTFVHGKNALGDIPIVPSRRRLDSRPAWRLIADLVRAHPHEVTILATGHMTNLALALRHDPGLAGLVREVVVMGGAFGYRGPRGNVTPAAEANFHGDPRAADEICAAAWPLSVVGLDVTTRTIMSDAYLADLRDGAGAVGRLLWDVTRTYVRFHASFGVQGIYVHDASAVARLLHPGLFSVVTGPVRVLTDSVAIGESIQKPAGLFTPPGAWDGRPAVTVCSDVDSEGVRAAFRQAIRALGA